MGNEETPSVAFYRKVLSTGICIQTAKEVQKVEFDFKCTCHEAWANEAKSKVPLTACDCGTALEPGFFKGPTLGDFSVMCGHCGRTEGFWGKHEMADPCKSPEEAIAAWNSALEKGSQ